MAINEQSLRDELTRWVNTLSGQQLLLAWRFRRHHIEVDAPPAPEGWIPVAIAAEQLALNPGHLRRRCATHLLHLGHAALYRPRFGGKPCWHLTTDALATLRASARVTTRSTPAAPSDPAPIPFSSPDSSPDSAERAVARTTRAILPEIAPFAPSAPDSSNALQTHENRA